MSFILKLNHLSDTGTKYADDCIYNFNPDGTLTVTTAGEVTYYSPSHWATITTRDGHKPGRFRDQQAASPVRTGRGPLGSTA
jgi:hypothetical protein